MARAGLRAEPVVVPPTALRPYLGFARLSPAALAAIARVVDQDEDFRARVAASVSPDTVGRGGWLWLTRPPGWDAELATIDAQASEREASRAAERLAARDERSAARRLAATQAALARAEALAEQRRVELERLRGELADARAGRSRVEARIAELESTVAELTEARATAVRNLKDAEARLVQRTTDAKVLKDRVRELEAQGAAAALPAEAVTPATDPESKGPVVGIDPGVLAAELTRAAQGAASLADGLSGLAAALGGSDDEPAPPELVAPSAGAGTAAAARRNPIRLPGGVLDDSVEAAEHLLRTPGAVLVVDGYNVTMTGWPELPAAEQRRRLVVALADLAARTATRVELVFDGAEGHDGVVAVPAPARQLVRVRFSPPGVEADDVVLDLVAQLPASRPVIVASSDNRVRQGARRGGANLLYSRQLLDTLGIGTT
ncbi:MAG TPA: NYN domain-containing protein [Acidimicrobiales bacterium]|nr:NYN domain-containing protein [Acidimicrobiales bacterium]